MNRKIRLGYVWATALVLAATCMITACAGENSPHSTPAAAPTEQRLPSQENSDSNEVKSAETPMESGTNEENTGTEITLAFGDTVIQAVLDDSETTRAFLDTLPLALTMSRYGDREYYASIGELPENGEAIDDFENGDVTYYTAGKSLAIFFGNAENSSQGDLIRMGKITSDLSLFDTIGDSVPVTISLSAGEEGGEMAGYDFSEFNNVEITGIELSGLSEEQLAVLYQQARYCQAMTEADIDTMDEIVSDNSVFTHMSGMQQTKEEYFADVEDGSLRYFTIGIENPVVEVNGNLATVTYTSVLNANAYGARGTYRMSGSHWFENRDGVWYSINNPER